MSPSPPEEASFDEAARTWQLSRYSDVIAALHDPRLWPDGAEAEVEKGTRVEGGKLAVRGEMLEAFSVSKIASWRPQFEAWACRAAEQLPEGCVVDLLGQFAQPWCLSLAILATGADPGARQRFFELGSRVIAGTGDPDGSVGQQHAAEASRELAGMLRNVTVPMAEPTFVGISQTFSRALAKAWVALIRNPREWARLRAEPDLLPAAMDELLRYGGIVRSMIRRAVEDTEVNGIRIAKGERLVLMVDSANRDPAQFADPGRLDLTRRIAGQVALGTGRNSCVGAPLIRAAGGAITSALVSRFERADLAGEVPWETSLRFAWPRAVPVLLYP
jgi:cytochrome P450